MPTLHEIKDAIAAEGYVGEPSNDFLAFCGWKPGEVLSDVTPTPADSKETLQADFARLKAEADKMSLPVEFAASFGRILGAVRAAGLIALTFALLTFTGCSRSSAERSTVSVSTVETLPSGRKYVLGNEFIVGGRTWKICRIDADGVIVCPKK